MNLVSNKHYVTTLWRRRSKTLHRYKAPKWTRWQPAVPQKKMAGMQAHRAVIKSLSIYVIKQNNNASFSVVSFIPLW